MMLPDHMIKALCIRDVRRPPLIDPFDADRVQPASVDLTLGNEFISFDDIEIGHIDLKKLPRDFATKVILPPNGCYILQPMEFILGVTAERVNIPDNIQGRLDGKSSLARIGLLIHVTGGFIDPGFSGPVTLEILNVFPKPIILRPGIPVCQMGFQQLAEPASVPYKGRYMNAQGVEASKYDGL